MMLTWLLHALYSTAIADLLSIAFGRLTPLISGISLMIGTFFAWKHAKRFKSSHPEFKWNAFSESSAGTLEIVLFTFLVYVGFRHFIWIFYRADFGWSSLSAYNFGDLPLHINYIRSMANGIAFPPHNPSFASQLLHYPFGPDLYNGLFEILGVRTQAHLTVVGIFAFLTSLVFLRAFGGWWAVGAFFLSGGFAGWDFATKGLGNSHQAVDWKNLLLCVFITQRGMLFALPVGIFLLHCTQKHFARLTVLNRSQMTVLGLMWAILPLFHLHTFVAISLMMLSFALANGGWRGARELFLSRMALIAYIPATYQVLASTEFLKKASVVKIRWGWMADSSQFTWFAIKNFGPWLFLPVFIAVALYRRRRSNFDSRETRALTFEFVFDVVLFAVFLNVMLAPWEWDNIKVLIWPYLGLARLAWIVVDPFLEKFRGATARGGIATVLFFSGFSVVLWSVQSPRLTGVQIYHTSQIAYAEGALANVPADAVFAAAMTHDHVLTYFGRMRAVGYEGHLWSHGIDASTAIPKMKSLMNGEGDWQTLVKDLGIDYIYWGPQEAAIFGSTPKPWMPKLKNVSRVSEHAVYSVHEVIGESAKTEASRPQIPREPAVKGD